MSILHCWGAGGTGRHGHHQSGGMQVQIHPYRSPVKTLPPLTYFTSTDSKINKESFIVILTILLLFSCLKGYFVMIIHPLNPYFCCYFCTVRIH